MTTSRPQANLNKLALGFHGVSYCLQTAHKPLIAYAQNYLADLFPVESAQPQTLVNFYWGETPAQSWQDRSILLRGRRLLQQGNSILQSEILELPGLQIEAYWQNEILIINAWYQPSSRAINIMHRLGRPMPKLYAILIYYLIYFPLLVYVEQKRGWHILHAGAVLRPEGAWILAGLPGSGKSTFTLSLLADPQARLLSDNLLLFDGQNVYACPEPLHISPATQAMLPDAVKSRLDDTGRDVSHSRRDFILSPPARAWQGQATRLFVLGLTDKTSLFPLNPQSAFDRLFSYDLLAKEVVGYNRFASTLSLISPCRERNLQHHKTLQALLSTVNCAELWLEKDGDLSQTINLLQTNL